MNRQPQTTSTGRIFKDRAGGWLVRGSGMVIIACILGILLFILFEVAPLLFSPKLEVRNRFAPPFPMAATGVTDDYRTCAAFLGPDGDLAFTSLPQGKRMEQQKIPGLHLQDVRTDRSGKYFTGTTENPNEVVILPVTYEYGWQDGERSVRPDAGPPWRVPTGEAAGRIALYTVAVDPSGVSSILAWDGERNLTLVKLETEENPFTGETTFQEHRRNLEAPGNLTALELAHDGKRAFGGTADGRILSWDLREDAALSPVPAAPPVGSDSPVTAMTLLIGGRTLVVGRKDGSISIWFFVRTAEGRILREIRSFHALEGEIRLLAPSPRNKGFAALDVENRLGLFHSTSDRVLWTGDSPVAETRNLSYTPKGDGLILGGRETIADLDLRNPHPEFSLHALFGKIWYEGYDKPDYVWQSSGATDDFEPKLSLVPLLIGSLKGTFYSLILAIPLGVLGAMYASQFMSPGLRGMVKPAVEIMAALPSVVLGFLAGLWLAPRLERFLGTLALMAIVLPVAAMATGWLFSLLPARFRHRFPAGIEAILTLFTLSGAGWFCLSITPGLEKWVLGGPTRDWIIHTLGFGYDQRNAVVVGLGMGFAVIPIIFSIAEDAFSNVPRHLVSGSLALGADRWRTVTRIVLPTASPGVFSAVIIGFGRAVGETMIVLMATGNTPILDWSPFSGFRTLSANIAVEIPEAPEGGTLYRTLFLAALLLFLLTFAVNTAAEMIRTRLRKRYANL